MECWGGGQETAVKGTPVNSTPTAHYYKPISPSLKVRTVHRYWRGSRSSSEKRQVAWNGWHPTSILATRQPVIVTGWRKLWRANNSVNFFKDFTDSVSSRQFRDFSTTVYCNKRLVLYKQVTILCFLYSCSHVVGWYDDRSVVLPIKYAICRTASAARCRPGRCCAPYMGSGRKKWLAVFKS